MLFALLVSSLLVSRPPQVHSALETLTSCTDLREETCLFAAAWLKMGGDAALPDILKAAPNMTPTGQLLTVNALGTMQSKPATDTLGKLARDSRMDSMARAVALDHLSRRPDPPKAKGGPLEVALSLIDDSDNSIRQAAVKMIADRVTPKDKKLLKVMIDASKDTEGLVRAEAIRGASFCDCPEAQGIIASGLRDTHPLTRVAAVEALAIVKMPDFVSKLIVADLIALMGSNDNLNKSIARALRHQTGKDFTDDATQWKRWLAENNR